MANPRDDPRGAPDGATLRAFLDHGPFVAFVADGAGRYLYVDPSIERLLGARWAEAARSQDPRVMSTGESVETLDAVPLADGSVRHWRVVRFAFPGTEGQRLVGGVAMDITAQHEAQARLADSERRYRHLVENAQGLICTHDMHGRLLTVNQAALTLTGLTAEQVIGQSLRDLLSPASRDAFPLYLERMRHVGSDAGLMNVRASNGRELAWQYRNVRVEEPGQPAYVLGHAQDVTDLRDAQEQLRQLAMTDDLTGLHNRRGFFINGSRLMLEVVRDQKGAALFYVDIDQLKVVNDTHGHDAGSALIVSTANVLKHSFRAADVLARLGGDEFVVLAVVRQDDIVTILNRLQWHLDKFNASAGLSFTLAMSIGVARFDPAGDQTLEDLLTEADAAMYRQKKPGGASPRGDDPA